MSVPAVLVAIVLSLGGCAPDAPVVTPQPTPSSTPVFASDEEALAAATEAYARYLEVSDQIARDGGQGAERLKGLVTADQYQKELEGFQIYTDEQIHIVGGSKFDSVALQSWYETEDGTAVVTIYACSDAADVRVIDGDGSDVTPTSRPTRSPFELEFRGQANNKNELELARSELWSGNDFC